MAGQPSEEQEAPQIVTVTNVKLSELPVSFEEIKEAVFELARSIQMQDQMGIQSCSAEETNAFHEKRLLE
jgi:hypothetical protein